MQRKQYIIITSTRHDGSFSRAAIRSPDTLLRKKIFPMFRRTFKNLNVDALRLMTMVQVHGKTVRNTDAQTSHYCYERTDSLLAARPGTIVMVRTADCIPVVLADPAHGAVAVVHAGWRGVKKGIALRTVQKMRQFYRTRPEDLKVHLGPSIRACCYVCSPQRAESFRRQFGRSVIRRHGSQRAIDLTAALKIQLHAIGIESRQITINPLCTSCSGRRTLFSYRSGDGTKAFCTAVMVLPSYLRYNADIR